MPLYEERCVDCEFINEHLVGKYTARTVRCKKCGGKTEREVSSVAFHDFHQSMHSTIHRPWVTNNIHPDGKPIEIKGHAQLAKECRKAGVVHVPDKHNRMG